MEYIWVQDQSTFIKDFEKWFFTPNGKFKPSTIKHEIFHEILKRWTHSFSRVTCDEHSKLCDQMESEIIATPLTIGTSY